MPRAIAPQASAYSTIAAWRSRRCASGHGLERIAYVDIDAHHGDGVFYAFEDDPAVIFADLHEDGHYLYPGTGDATECGRGAAEGTKLNIPMAPGADDAAFARAWPRVITHLERHEPQFIILQCGADSLEGDPITHLRYTRCIAWEGGARACRPCRPAGAWARAGARGRRLQPQPISRRPGTRSSRI